MSLLDVGLKAHVEGVSPRYGIEQIRETWTKVDNTS